MRAITSAKLMPEAATSMRTWPAPSVGSGCSCTCSTPGPPCLVMTTACMPLPRLARSLVPLRLKDQPHRCSGEVDGPTVDKSIRGNDLLDDRVGHGCVGG